MARQMMTDRPTDPILTWISAERAHGCTGGFLSTHLCCLVCCPRRVNACWQAFAEKGLNSPCFIYTYNKHLSRQRAQCKWLVDTTISSYPFFRSASNVEQEVSYYLDYWRFRSYLYRTYSVWNSNMQACCMQMMHA